MQQSMSACSRTCIVESFTISCIVYRNSWKIAKKGGKQLFQFSSRWRQQTRTNLLLGNNVCIFAQLAFVYFCFTAQKQVELEISQLKSSFSEINPANFNFARIFKHSSKVVTSWIVVRIVDGKNLAPTLSPHETFPSSLCSSLSAEIFIRVKAFFQKLPRLDLERSFLIPESFLRQAGEWKKKHFNG